VYGGTIKESEKCSRAVDETKGEILVYQSKPIGAFFHSNCGGQTEEIGAVWGQNNVPYLPRKKCSFGTGDPRYHWSLTLSDNVIVEALSKAGRIKGNSLRKLSVKNWSASGRAQTVSVETNMGTYSMRGNDFRIALNPEKIRSTLWTRVDREDGGYHFEGMGWGHGIGMCQWGAKGMAERGDNYRDIVFFYYPHTTIQLWNRL
jgi:stage II sporulation protein D